MDILGCSPNSVRIVESKNEVSWIPEKILCYKIVCVLLGSRYPRAVVINPCCPANGQELIGLVTII